MDREVWGWLSIFCICALWIGGIVYFLLDFRENMLLSLTQLSHSLVQIERRDMGLADLFADVRSIKSLIPRRKCVVDAKGCVKAECWAKLVLMVSDLRQSFFNGVLTSKEVQRVRPLLLELGDDKVNKAFVVLEGFNENSDGSYAQLRGSLAYVKRVMRTNRANAMSKMFAKWVSVESNHDLLWQKFNELERYVAVGSWTAAYDLAQEGVLGSVEELSSWRERLGRLLAAEKSLLLIYDRLAQHVMHASGGA